MRFLIFLIFGFFLGRDVFALDLTIFHINDVYHVSRRDTGGLARASTLIEKLRKENPNVLLTFGGDAFFPSIESLVFKGEQMVEAFNAMKVDLAVVGNHEFDDPDAKTAKKRLKESDFPWLAANIRDKEGQPLPNTKDWIIKDVGGFKIAFFGVCLLFDNHLANFQYEDPVVAADRALEEIKKENPDLIIGLTHVNFPQDQEIARRHPEVDLILGGHEHDNRFGQVGKTLIVKSDSECRLNYIVKIKVTPPPPVRTSSNALLEAHPGGGGVTPPLTSGGVKRGQDGKALKEITAKAMPLTSDTDEDPKLVEIHDKYNKKLEKELGEDRMLARLKTPLVVEENDTLVVHLKETNACNMVTDAYRDVAQTDVALEMAGALRSEENIRPGRLTKYKILALLPQNDKLVKITLKGATLKTVLNRWVANEGNGGFACVSGLTLTYDQSRPYGDKVLDARVGGNSLDLERVYSAAVNSWAAKSIQSLDPQVEIIPLEKEMLVREALEDWVLRQGVLSPAVEGRIKKVSGVSP